MKQCRKQGIDYEDALRMSQWDNAPSAAGYLANSSFYDNDLIFDLYTGKYTPKFQGLMDAGLTTGEASRIIQWDNPPSAENYLSYKDFWNNPDFINPQTGKWAQPYSQDLKNHLDPGDGYKKARGFKGAHTENAFLDALDEKLKLIYRNESYNITDFYTTRENIDYPGIVEYTYKLPKSDGRQPLVNEFIYGDGTNPWDPKTVVRSPLDSEDILNWADQILANNPQVEISNKLGAAFVHGIVPDGYDYAGLQIEIRINSDGTISTVYPIFPEN